MAQLRLLQRKSQKCYHFQGDGDLAGADDPGAGDPGEGNAGEGDAGKGDLVEEDLVEEDLLLRNEDFDIVEYINEEPVMLGQPVPLQSQQQVPQST